MSTVNASQFSYAMTSLDKLVADLKSRVGLFLGNQSNIQDSLTMAQSISKSAEGQYKDAAKILIEKGNALFKIQSDAEKQAAQMLSDAGDLKTLVGTSAYSFLSTDPLQWGWRQGELLVELLDRISLLSTTAASISKRVAQQNSDVATFQKEVLSVQQSAAGTGILPKITSFIGGTVGAASGGLSKLIWPLAVVATVGGLAYMASPGLFRRSAS